MEFTEGFYIFVITSVIAFLALCSKQCYKMKCSNFKLCGGILDVTRDTSAEEKEDTMIIERGGNLNTDRTIMSQNNMPNRSNNHNVPPLPPHI